jgi:divalent metal cation (Fe/Co/Zn/Cd) transporter
LALVQVYLGISADSLGEATLPVSSLSSTSSSLLIFCHDVSGLIAAGIHTLFKVAALFSSLIGSVLAANPPNFKFSYGYERVEVMVAFANGVLLIFVSYSDMP